MSALKHHIPDAMLAAYAAGNLHQAFSLVVACHISRCDECRAAVEAHQTVGGALMESTDAVSVSSAMKSDVLAMLDDPIVPEPTYQRSGVYPAPIMACLKGRAPRWKRLGMGVRQDILSADEGGSARLLYIPPGQAVPDHGHNGIELTLVLQGSFSDETGEFGVGDVEVADDDLDHTPVAGPDTACICLAATDAPLRFHSLVPRMLQPLFRI